MTNLAKKLVRSALYNVTMLKRPHPSGKARNSVGKVKGNDILIIKDPDQNSL